METQTNIDTQTIVTKALAFKWEDRSHLTLNRNIKTRARKKGELPRMYATILL